MLLCRRGGQLHGVWHRAMATNKSPLSQLKQLPPLFFVDPVAELQPYLKVPLFSANERPFVPTEQQKEESCGRMLSKQKVEFVTSAVDLRGCPRDDVPEVIFLGESNAGKSSLIKALFAESGSLVRTSKKPGHTKTLNFFQVGKNFRFVDAPGYGFRQPSHYIQSVEAYLKNRKCLCRTLLLADTEAGLSKWDVTAFQMLEEFRVPYALVLTKIDLASTSDRLMNVLKMKELQGKHASNYCFSQPFLVSSKTLEGMGLLETFIAYITSVR